MRLEDMTKAQLLNIILRKDDVETRLRAEIATLEQENKRMERTCLTKAVAISILINVICMVTFALTSCGNSNQCNRIESCFDTIKPIDGNQIQLTIGEVVFGVNMNNDNIILISSAQVDDPRVLTIVEYLNDKFGEAQEDEPFNYWWQNDMATNRSHGLTIRLRPLHTEEGGTVMMIN